MRKIFRVILIVWMTVLVLSVCIGRYPITLSDMLNIFMGKPQSDTVSAVFWGIRLPRVLAVAFGGGALALAGAVFQTVFSNPLVSPDVLGVTGGCSVGAVFAILFLPSFMLPISSFACGAAAVLFALFLAKFVKYNKVLGMVLAGIAVGSVSSAALMFMKFFADPEKQLASIEYWLMGSFQNISGYQKLTVILALGIPCCLILYFLRFPIQLLALGDDSAESLGIRPNAVRLWAVSAATVLVAVVVSAAGTVNWIGLVAPHIVRLMGGKDITKSMGSCFLTGSVLLMAADLCARSLTSLEIPIGIFTSLFGAAFLAFLIFRGGLSKGGREV